MESHPPTGPPPISFFLKRGTLMGAALGMLAGMVYLAIVGVAPDAEVSSIIIWRNYILIGAALGLLLGGGVGWWVRSRKDKSNCSTEPEKHVSQSS